MRAGGASLLGLSLVALPMAAWALTARTAASTRRGLRAGAASLTSAAEHFDYLVIGGGSGGVASARRAAGYGAKVAVVEKARLGGTCVNVGCVPKKVMFNAASIQETIHEAKHLGFDVGSARFDWNILKRLRDNYVKRLNGIYENMLGNSGVQYLTGEAVFASPNSVAVGDQEYSAEHILIAVGGEPTPPPFEGVEHCINSDGFFDLEDTPGRVAVIGAGYIAVELAGVLHSLGADTTLLCRGERPLRKFDMMLQESLVEEMQRQGLGLRGGSTPKAVTKADDGTFSVHLEDGTVLDSFDQVVVATGRRPLSYKIGLDNAGVAMDAKGYIQVDEFQNTNVPNVYALGDVCGKVELTPMAIAAGRRLADRLFGGIPDAKADYDMVPTVIFSHPPIGTIGLSEAEAVEEYGADDVKVYTSRFTNLLYGPWDLDPADKPKTNMKVVCVGPEERVVGLHVIGLGADEMLQGFGVAMKLGCTKADLDKCVAIHPTASEEFVTLAPWGLSGAKAKL